MVRLVERAKPSATSRRSTSTTTTAPGSRAAQEIVEHGARGRATPELVEPIAPGDDVDFVVKARHSIFYETPLEYLLRQGDIERLILVGQVTEQCILYSALDAYIRHFEVHVPPDAVAHIHADLAEAALKMMERNMDADLTPAGSCSAAEAERGDQARRTRGRRRAGPARPASACSAAGSGPARSLMPARDSCTASASVPV